MTEETQVPAAVEVPTLYVQEYDGTFVEQMDIIYPEGTVFYVRHPDGTFEPENTVMPADMELNPSTMSKEYIIETAVDFLRQNGYTVEAFNEANTSPIPDRNNFEAAFMLAKLRGLVTSHMSNRTHIDEACRVIDELKSLL